MTSKNVIPANFGWTKYSVSDLKNLVNRAKQLIAEDKKNSKKNAANLNFKNFMHAGEVMNAKVGEMANILWCFLNLSTDAKLRETARTTELEFSKILREYAYDEENYNMFKKYYDTAFKQEVKNKSITEEEIKIVEDSKEGFKKMGMELPKIQRKKLMDISNKINKIASEFEKANTANYGKGIYFKKEELKGVPEQVLGNFKFDSKKKKYFVSIRPTEISYVFKYCEIEDTRKKMSELSAFGVGDVNTKRLAQILKLREEMAKTVGYKTFGHLAVSKELLKDPKDIDLFLRDLLNKLNPHFKIEKRGDFEALLEWEKKNISDKKKHSKKLKTWNWEFAGNLSNEKELKIKEEEYKPYFEVQNAISVIFEIWEKLFDVKAEEVSNFKFFHDSETVYKFTDISSNQSLGYGVFDLFPREGKYGHACMSDIMSGYTDLEGNKHEKLIYLVCNFMQNKDGKNLLSFNDLLTLYHEAGHFLHFMLMKYDHKSSIGVSNDFVEIPSQFFENFVLNQNFVKEKFRHYETGEEMPDRLLKKLNALNSKGEASAWMTQSMMSLFDQELHGKNISKYHSDFKKINKLYENLFKKHIGIEAVKKRNFASRFSHITHGYQARYYSYVISKVYSVDFWAAYAKDGIVKNPVIEKYKKFLEAGGTREEIVLVKEFLGRKPSLKPFLSLVSKKK